MMFTRYDNYEYLIEKTRNRYVLLQIHNKSIYLCVLKKTTILWE